MLYREIDYAGKSATGGFNKTISSSQESYKSIPWTYSPDGILKDGCSVIFKSKKTDGFLVFNMLDKQPGLAESYIVTTTKVNPGPVARSIFIIKKADRVDPFGSDSVIRYGQKVRLEASPYAFPKKLQLSSTVKGAALYSPVTRAQEVSMNTHDSYNNIWVFEAVDPNVRLEMQGQPVRANDPILIRHCPTQTFLASDCNVYKNAFGNEYEAMVHNFCMLNKTQNLALEKRGNITVDVPTKFQLDQNVFCALTAPNASFDAPIDELHRFDLDTLMGELRAKIMSRSSGGVKHLARIFKAMDKNGNGNLDVEDFRWGFIDFGFNLTHEEAQQLLHHFDKDKNGNVSFNEFLQAIKVSKSDWLIDFQGNMSETRKAVVRAAYNKLDANKDGRVTLKDLAQSVDVSSHPDVLARRRSEDDIY